jgi:Flp pilus assembly pilin Flp
MEWIKRFMARAPERGASLVEYALLVALIAVVCVGAVTFLGRETSDDHQAAADGIADEQAADSGGCETGYHRGTPAHGESPDYCHLTSSMTEANGFHTQYYPSPQG